MTREQHLEYEASLHRRYFEPFDRLLERKAEYYLQKAEEGKESRFLLDEIEVLERFREYVTILETMCQEQMEHQYKAANLAEYWKTRYRNAAQWSILWRESFEALESKLTRLHPCNQHSTK